jgi:AcrR family transcriptional regulator
MDGAVMATAGPARKRGIDGPTSARVLATSAQLFRRKGYAESTTRELAEMLGIRKASLYHHITSKEDLLYQICVQSLTQMTDEVLKARSETNPLGRLHTMIKAHIIQVTGARELHAVMLTEMRGLTPEHLVEVVALRDQYEAVLRESIGESQARGLIRNDIEDKYLTLSLLNLLNWSIFWFSPSGDLDAIVLGDILATVYLEGVQVPEAEERASTPDRRQDAGKRN